MSARSQADPVQFGSFAAANGVRADPLQTARSLLESAALPPGQRLSRPPPKETFASASHAAGVADVHALPAGMRDQLPSEAREHSVAGRRVVSSLELCGYQRVNVPAFEYTEVLGRAPSGFDAGDVLRFVEPDTGEVVALRPDMTPQVARLVASRLREAPGPCRLCYQGSVLRRRRERARQRRQITQVGFELIGVPAIAGDLEVLSVAAHAVRSTGLTEFTLDLAHAGVSGALLAQVPETYRERALDALRHKDVALLRRISSQAGLPRPLQTALGTLPTLCGGVEIWDAAACLTGTPAEQPAKELRTLAEAAVSRSLASSIVIDLGETCRFDYYTGAMFQIIAPGPGEPVGAGGRYDTLFSGFGFERSAAGFGVDLGNLVWALREAQVVLPVVPRVLVLSADSDPLLLELRARGIACASHPSASESDAQIHANAWGYTHLARHDGNNLKVVHVQSGQETALTGSVQTLADALTQQANADRA